MKKILFAFVVLAFVLAACSPAATENPAQPASTEAPAQPAATDAPKPTEAPAVDPNTPVMGGTVIVGTPQEPGTLSPLLSSATIDDVINAFIVEGLVTMDGDGKYAPVLAEELPTASEDGLTVTYKLKKDIKFSNGDPFTLILIPKACN